MYNGGFILSILNKLSVAINKMAINIEKKYQYRKIYIDLKQNKDKRILLIGTPIHGNMGDHAIAIATYSFLKTNFSGSRIIEIPGDFYRLKYKSINKLIKNEDVILIQGGGFLGNLWMNEEKMVRDIIINLPNNNIIILPQTIFFEDTLEGNMECMLSKQIFQNHEHLSICLRERASLNYVRNHLIDKNPKASYFIPDMALYLNKTPLISSRSGILLCLRNDKECAISIHEKNRITELASKTGEDVHTISTVIPNTVLLSHRTKEFNSIISEFSSSKLVITDRLHGMLFAAITGTPCIALNNLSRKVEGVYEWLKPLNYITFIEDLDLLPLKINDLLNIYDNKYSSKYLETSFETLKNLIEENITLAHSK